MLYTLGFRLETGGLLSIATTRPELLPACGAIFVHPQDQRYRALHGKRAYVPLTDRTVSIIPDPDVDPAKGSGAVMCCTFGDAADVMWWHRHEVPLVDLVQADGRLGAVAGAFAGLSLKTARAAMVEKLTAEGYLQTQEQTLQRVRVHERCDTPVEYRVTPQWFIKVLNFKEIWQRAGDALDWYPASMQEKYRHWIDQLAWDWCISRQRRFGVAFPVWYCGACNAVRLAQADRLPVCPQQEMPTDPCTCGQTAWRPEVDVMDTWATSALTPQIAAGWHPAEALDEHLFPSAVRPLAHDIIRTWAFYSIVKAQHHFGRLPWKAVMVSGWGLNPDQAKGKRTKISKSRGGSAISPQALLERYPADALRYWAASSGLGRDTLISQERIQAGAKLLTKLWNVARFSERFLQEYRLPAQRPQLSLADAWILGRLDTTLAAADRALARADYAAAQMGLEVFFWTEWVDNYLEMAKKRLYDPRAEGHAGALFALYCSLRDMLKGWAPFIPFICEAIYQALFAVNEGGGSLHQTAWPQKNSAQDSGPDLAQAGKALVGIATQVRRWKSEANIPLGQELTCLRLRIEDGRIQAQLSRAVEDIASITRAKKIVFDPKGGANWQTVDGIGICIEG